LAQSKMEYSDALDWELHGHLLSFVPLAPRLFFG